MFFSKLTSAFTQNTAVLQMTQDLMNGQYILRSEHERRVKELLDAGTTQVEARRKAVRDAEDAEHDALHAIRIAHESKGLVKAVDWAHENMKNSNATPALVFDAIRWFCEGYNHKTIITDTDKDSFRMQAYRAGADAFTQTNKLLSAATAVGMMPHGKEHTV